MSTSAPTAEEITRRSKSNLALAFIALPRERRQDISLFYAFCRVVDDLADEPDRALEERRIGLQRWRESLYAPVAEEPALAPAVRELIAKYALNPEHFSEIITGCEMDLAGARYATWEDLRAYCYRVASVVGLISIEIFGYQDPRCREYAVELGLALQLTNILRDVGEDYRNGARIYLPQEDLARFGYSEDDLARGVRNDAFLRLMRFEAERAREFYRKAVAALPAADRRTMVAAEIMRAIYGAILTRMEEDGFRVFDRRYRLSRWEKLVKIGRVFLRNRVF